MKHEFTVKELLSEELEAELDRREGEWAPFTCEVFRRIDVLERAPRRMSLEDQAIAHLKERVDTELIEMSPQFEDAFRDSLEERIWNEGRAPTLWSKFRNLSFVDWNWFKDRFSIRFGAEFGVAAVAVAVAIFAVFRGMGDVNNAMTDAPIVRADDLRAGHFARSVDVEAVEFSGDVMVVPEEGLTVIYLSQAS